MAEDQMVQTALGPLAVQLRGGGPTAVLWHSLFVDEKSWDGVVEQLGRQRRLVLITGPGHGRSPDPGRRYTLSDCADAAGSVLDALGVTEPVDWVGNAWGGHVGALFAARWPDRCRTLVMLGTPVQALSRGERANTTLLLAIHRLLGPIGLIQDGVTEVLLSAATRARHPDATAYVERCLTEAERAALRNAVVSISLHRQDLAPELPRISAPTLVVTGSDHQGWTPEQARAACTVIPDAVMAVVPDAAYLVPLEAPEETTRLILEHWTAHPGVPAG